MNVLKFKYIFYTKLMCCLASQKKNSNSIILLYGWYFLNRIQYQYMWFIPCSLLRIFSSNLHYSGKITDYLVKNKPRHWMFPTSYTSCVYLRCPLLGEIWSRLWTCFRFFVEIYSLRKYILFWHHDYQWSPAIPLCWK